ncbi:hypothetical protein J2X61_006161 [Bacillus sp. 3255]|nr:hypothetical protein [Bacillus sp. 3255]
MKVHNCRLLGKNLQKTNYTKDKVANRSFFEIDTTR